MCSGLGPLIVHLFWAPFQPLGRRALEGGKVLGSIGVSGQLLHRS